MSHSNWKLISDISLHFRNGVEHTSPSASPPSASPLPRQTALLYNFHIIRFIVPRVFLHLHNCATVTVIQFQDNFITPDIFLMLVQTRSLFPATSGKPLICFLGLWFCLFFFFFLRISCKWVHTYGLCAWFLSLVFRLRVSIPQLTFRGNKTGWKEIWEIPQELGLSSEKVPRAAKSTLKGHDTLPLRLLISFLPFYKENGPC